MALVSTPNLQTTLDKLARWAMMSTGDPAFGGSFDAGMAAADAACFSGASSLFNLVTATSNESWIGDMASSSRTVDEIPPVPPTRFLFSVVSVAAIFTAIDAHIKTYAGGPTTLDAYLTSLNGAAGATPTLRLHQALYDHVKTYSRQNVFVGADQVVAHFIASGAAAGTYTHDAALPTFVAGAKLVAKNVGALTSNTSITVTGKKQDGTTASLTATITVLTDAHETNLSTTTALFVDVTNITVTGATSGNRINIVAKTDRDISAA